MPRVAIIYLTFYDARQYIDEAVLSLEKQTYPRDRLAFVVVDNSVHGPSAQYVKETVVPKSGKTLPLVHFIENETNTGFAGGNNIGIRWAMEQGFDYVFLLNNDAKLHPEAITEVVRVAETDPKIGAVQSLILLSKEPERVNTSGNFIHYLGFGITRDYLRRATDLKLADAEPIGYASGAGALYRVAALRQVGTLEEYYWMYHEDLELGWRLRLTGWSSVLAPRSLVYHDYSFSRSASKIRWMERNRWLAHLSHLSWRTLLLFAPAMLAMEMLVLGGALLRGWFTQKVGSYADLFSPASFCHIREKRRQSRAMRVIGDREATSLFLGRIEHQETNSLLMRHVVNPVFDFYWRVIRRFL